MTKNLSIATSSQELRAELEGSSTLLGRGLATIHKKQLVTANQDARYRIARDIYDRITDFGRNRRFDPENLPKSGTKLDLFTTELIRPLQTIIDQTYQLVDAFRQLKQLADEGYGKAYFVIASIFLGGQGIAKNIEEYTFFNKIAFQWLFENSKLNNPEIWRDLGRIYFESWKSENHNLDQAIYALDQAIVWLRRSAEQGDSEAQCHLGFIYEELSFMCELEITDDEGFEQAVYWYRKAAEQGHPYAQFQLGSMYDAGKGIEQDIEQAFYWYRKAAEQGEANAQFCVGTGESDLQNYKQAVFWYQKSAEQGDEDAQLNLGLMYLDGIGVEQDHEQAISWLTRAALNGNSFAQTSLGSMYQQGLGVVVVENHEQAVYWYTKAAEQGNLLAQEMMKRLAF